VPSRRLLHDARAEPRRPAARDEGVEDDARRGAREEDERLLGVIAEGERALAAGEGVRLRKRGDERVGVDVLHVQPLLGVGGRAVEDAEVDAPVVERLGLLQRVHLEQREPDVGQVHAEEAEHVGEDRRVGRRLDEADAEPPDLAARRALGSPLRALGLGERETRLGEEGAPRRGERHAARDALEERRAELALEVADLPAERRLRDVQAPGGAPEVPLLRDGREIAEVPELHRD
jgi:hypothetical protein